MNDEDLRAELAEGRCPDCGGTDFRPGPRGALSVNVECTGCRSRFNVAQPPGTNAVFMAHRIERESEGGADWPHVIFTKGQRVDIVSPEGRAPALITMTSSNGISLVLQPDGGDLPIPAIYAGRGDYACLLTGVHFRIEPHRPQ